MTSVKCITITGAAFCIKANEFKELILEDDKSWKMVEDRIK